jgi:dipeptidase D
MNKELLKLEPKQVWKNFVSLTQIPRPSKSEDKIQEFMMSFGEKLGLETIKDEVGNIIIRKPATKGLEKRRGVILQGHLDMVPQKNSDTIHDFKKDPIQAFVDGDWVTAKGTTLGADNGMGVAAIMSILESKDLPHGPIEALFTCDEETGMTGAFGLKAGMLYGDILMNLDSEDEGELYIGCAGGVDTSAVMTYEKKDVPAKSTAFKVSVSGLKGGHSGVDIPLQRGNANKIIFRFLWHALKNHEIRLSSIDGGSLRNAIPREAFAVITVANSEASKLQKYALEFENIIKTELKEVDPGFIFKLEKSETPKFVMDKKTTKNLIFAIRSTIHGAVRFVDNMPEIPETSTNLAIVKSEKGKILIGNLVRSSVDSAKDNLKEEIESIFTLAGAQVTHEGEYPGWRPDFNSSILNTMKEMYNKQFGKVPEVKIIHAGLECGLLGGVYPKWDMISFGPTIRFPHSPDEKVHIASVKKFWEFLTETLKNIPSK